jgi:hypothetical protein
LGLIRLLSARLPIAKQAARSDLDGGSKNERANTSAEYDAGCVRGAIVRTLR